MRFITEFEITPNEIKEGNTHIKDHRKSCAEERLGGLISELFGFKKAIFMDYSGLPVDRHSLEIEAFPVDKWVEFKQKLFMECGMPEPNGVAILEMIKDLEFYTNNKQAVDAITKQQLNNKQNG